jgi:hypothetical protein
MAYNFTAASSQYLSVASSPVSVAPFTLSLRAQAATTNQNAAIVAVESGVTDRFAVSLISGALTIQTIASGGSEAINTSTGSALSANVDYHLCGVWTSTTSRTPYLDGVAGSTNANSVSPPANISLIKIGARIASSTLGAFFNGRVAEVGIWNVALTAAEVASLADGMTCDKVRPQSLVFYAPLVRDLIDYKGGLAITNNNTATVANHPRVYA